MKNCLSKFIITYGLYCAITGVVLGIKPEKLTPMIIKECKAPLSEEEKQALRTQTFPEANNLKFNIFRHLLGRDHVCFFRHPMPMSLTEANNKFNDINQQNNANVSTFEFLTMNQNSSDGYSQKIKNLDEKIEISELKIKTLENKINDLKRENEKISILEKIMAVNDGSLLKVLEILKKNDSGGLINKAITTVTPDCFDVESDDILKNILGTQKDLFHSFCLLEKNLIKKLKDIFLKPLEICRIDKSNDNISFFLKSETPFSTLMYAMSNGKQGWIPSKDDHIFILKGQLIGSFYKIDTIYPVPKLLEHANPNHNPNPSTTITYRINNIFELSEVISYLNDNILIDKDFLLEDIIQTVSRHFNTIFGSFIVSKEDQIKGAAYIYRKIFEQSLSEEDRKKKTKAYQAWLKREAPKFIASPTEKNKNNKNEQETFSEACKKKWCDIFEPVTIFNKSCAKWYSGSLTKTGIPWFIPQGYLGAVCLDLDRQTYMDLFENVKILVKHTYSIKRIKGNTIEQFIIYIAPPKTINAKYLSGNIEPSYICCLLEYYDKKTDNDDGMRVSAFPIPKSKLPNDLEEQLLSSKLQGNFSDLLFNLKVQDVSFYNGGFPGSFKGEIFNATSNDCYTFLLEGDLIRNGSLASLRGMRWILYLGESGIVDNETQQKLKECERKLREAQKTHNLRVQKREILQKMYKNKKDLDDQTKAIQEIQASNGDLANKIRTINGNLDKSINVLKEDFGIHKQRLIDQHRFDEFPSREKITSMVFHINEGDDPIDVIDNFFTSEIQSVTYRGPNEFIPGALYFDIEFKDYFIMFDCNRKTTYDDTTLSNRIRIIVLQNGKEENDLKLISAYPTEGENSVSATELKEDGLSVQKALESNNF